jgi:hypothetical protein
VKGDSRRQAGTKHPASSGGGVGKPTSARRGRRPRFCRRDKRVQLSRCDPGSRARQLIARRRGHARGTQLEVGGLRGGVKAHPQPVGTPGEVAPAGHVLVHLPGATHGAGNGSGRSPTLTEQEVMAPHRPFLSAPRAGCGRASVPGHAPPAVPQCTTPECEATRDVHKRAQAGRKEHHPTSMWRWRS